MSSPRQMLGFQLQLSKKPGQVNQELVLENCKEKEEKPEEEYTADEDPDEGWATQGEVHEDGNEDTETRNS